MTKGIAEILSPLNRRLVHGQRHHGLVGAAMTKRGDAVWTAGSGNGGLDTGVIGNAWYHIFAIARSDTMETDYLFSLSLNSPTMPTHYDLKRRIGSRERVSGAWRPFIQVADEVVWAASIADVSIATLPATATMATLTVPPGVPVKAKVSVQLHISSNACSVLVSSPFSGDEAPSVSNRTAAALSNVNAADTNEVELLTNSSAQIRYRGSSAAGVNNFSIRTRGFVDTRGRLA